MDTDLFSSANHDGITGAMGWSRRSIKLFEYGKNEKHSQIPHEGNDGLDGSSK